MQHTASRRPGALTDAAVPARARTRRRVASAALVGLVTLVGGAFVTASPAGAHAVLVSSDPAPGVRIEDSPSEIVLRFTEPVTADLGGVRLFDDQGDRVELGSTGQLDGDPSTVTAEVPATLDDGGYVATWRVVSGDSHPVRGAFTFRVGETDSTSAQLDDLSSTLLTAEGGSTSVGVLFAVDRAAVFLGTTVLVGALGFIVLLWPAGLTSRRARRLVWSVWGLAFVASVFSIGLQGAFAEGLPLGDVVSPSVTGDVLGTRFGEMAALRTGLVLLAASLVLALFRPVPPGGSAGRRSTPAVGIVTVLLGLGALLTISLAGHATTGILPGWAVVADVAHLLGVAAWIGGLAVVLVAVLPGPETPDASSMGPPVTSFSSMAPWAIALVVTSGVFQAWRQVGSFGALTGTDYGTVLIVKLVVFAVLLLVAWMSRTALRDRIALSADTDPHDEAGDPMTRDELEVADRYLAGRLRRLVAVEVALAVVIFGVTAVLVNAQPARSEDTEPFAELVDIEVVMFDVLVTPAVAGLNDIHATTLTHAGAQQDVLEMRMELSLPSDDIGPIVASSSPGETGAEIQLRRLAPGHYAAFGVDLPISGDWELAVSVLLDRDDEVTGTTSVPIR